MTENDINSPALDAPCGILDQRDPEMLITYVIDVLEMAQNVAAFNPGAFESAAQSKGAGDGIYFLVSCLIGALERALEGIEMEKTARRAQNNGDLPIQFPGGAS